MTLFAIATLTPVGLLLLGALWGGVWLLAALAYLTVLTYALDRMRALPAPEAAPGQEFPAGEGLSLVLGLAHFALLALAVRAVGGDSGLGMAERLLAVLGFGLFFGQVSNSNAHELIHKPGRGLRWLGVAVFSSVLFGHHASAHPKVHHPYVGSDQDPNSAPLGMGFYHFALRAWAGSFLAGWRAENALRARGHRRLSLLRHPYAAYVALSAGTLAGAAALAGWAGVAALIVLALYTQMQLLLSDYVQHYGLRRHRRADGRLEPVGPQHSWNGAPWFSAAVMLNAPRHSDHHLNPARPYPALRLAAASMPVLPRSLPVMAMLALWPGAWRRVMDAKVALWQARPIVTVGKDLPAEPAAE